MKVREITPEQLKRGWNLYTWAENKLEHKEYEVLRKTEHGTYIVVDPLDDGAEGTPS